MKARRVSSVTLLASLALLLSLIGCIAERPALETFDVVSLEDLAMADVVRRELENQRAVVLAELEEQGQPGALAAALGELGSLLQVYGFDDKAYRSFEQAAEVAPDDGRWPYFMGFLDQRNGRLDVAAQRYREALRLLGSTLACRVRLAEVEIERGRPAVALELLEPELSKGNAPIFHAAGRALLALGEAAPAAENLERALELDPLATRVHQSLGVAYRLLGDRDRSAAHLQQAGSVDTRLDDPLLAALLAKGNSPHALTRRGLDSLSAGDAETGIELLGQALEDDEGNSVARRNLGIALARTGRLDEAIDQYRELVVRDPLDAAAHQALGSLLAQTGDVDQAVASFRRAVEVAPGFVQARLSLAAGLRALGDPRAALGQLDRLRDGGGATLDALILRGRVLSELGRLDEAALQFDSILEAQPQNVAARVALAESLAATGRDDKAEATLRTGLELADSSTPPSVRAQLLLGLGQLQWRREERDAALRSLEQALALAPQLLATSEALGEVYLASGRLAEAEEAYRRVAQERPAYAPAALALAQVRIRQGRWPEAAQGLEQAGAALPGNHDLQRAMAHLLATSPVDAVRDGERALRLAQAAYQGEPSAENAMVLGMALAEAGRFDDAVRLQEQLVQAARQRGDAGVARHEALLERYRRRQPVRTALPR